MKFYLKYLLLILLIIGSHKSVLAQKQGKAAIDSLLSELPKQKEDTNKVKLLNELSWWYNAENPLEGIKFGQQGLDLATKLNWKKGMARANVYIGSDYFNMSDFPHTLNLWSTALKIYEEIGDKAWIARLYGNFVLLYKSTGDFPKALDYALKSLKICEDNGDVQQIARSSINISQIYLEIGSNSKALEYSFKALKIGESIGEKDITSQALGSIGNIYQSQGFYQKALEYYSKSLKIDDETGNNENNAATAGNIASCYVSMKDYTKALEYDFKSLKMGEKSGNLLRVAETLGAISEIYCLQKDYLKGLEYDFKAAKIAEQIGDKEGIARNTLNIGTTYLESCADTISKPWFLQQIAEGIIPHDAIPKNKVIGRQMAHKYLQNALALSKEINAIDIMRESYHNLSLSYQLMGDYRKSLEASTNYHAIKDSIFNKENDKKIMQQGLQYDFDKKEAIAKIESDKKIQKEKLLRNGFGVGFVIVFLFAIVFFAQRNKIKEGKQKSDELLLNILPAEVAEELKAKGSADAKLINEVTVLFTDFKGFTQFSEKLTPHELVSEINTCFSAFDNIMQKYGVEKIKTIGDAYMAAGGLPTPNKTHATDVIKAALEIQTFMQKYKAEKELKNELFIEIRIGVHTGPVVAGIVGIKKFQYDIWGDTVNTASRMESSGEAGKVNISETTYELVKGEFECEYRGEIKAKNKGNLKMYFVKAI